MVPKPDFCRACPINDFTCVNEGEGYVPLQLPTKPSTQRVLLVGEASGENEAREGKPFVGNAGQWLNNILAAAGLDRTKLHVINTIGCRPKDNIYPTDRAWRWTSRDSARRAVEYCAEQHLQPALRKVNPDKIIALGEHALNRTTGHHGVMVWRGSALPTKDDPSQLKVIPTLHPSYLARDAKMVSCVIGDLRKPLKPVPEYYELFGSVEDLRRFGSKVLAFDFEWDYNGAITLCGLSDRNYHCLTAGWASDKLQEFKRIFEQATDLIGHNIIGADTRHFEQMRWKVTARMHDTMLKQHLCQPDYRHGLGFVASVLTNKMFWKGKGEEQEDADGNVVEIKTQWKTWNTPQAIPRALGGYGGCVSDDEAFRLYNARDTDSSFQINTHLDILLKRYDLEKVYWNVSLPIAYIVRDISDAGVAIDPGKVGTIRETLSKEIAQLELTLPEGLRPETHAVTRQVPAPPGTYKPVHTLCKGSKKSPHEATTITFLSPGDTPQCPNCLKDFRPRKLHELKKLKVPGEETTQPWNSSQKVMAYAKQVGLKAHFNRKRGTEAADVNARKGWGRTHPEFRIIDRLKDLITERNNFAKAGMQDVHRLYFNLLVHGTSEGRFSSSGKRQGIDPNIQNQPASIRGIYIPDHQDWSFIELDYASGENMLTAHLASDHTRLARLRQPGYSEHLELAKQLFALPANVTKTEAQNWEGKDLYDIGKHVNHGSNYGMTHVKLKEYLDSTGSFYSEKECKAFIQAGKDLNPETARWQAETIEHAKRDGVLTNPFGRKRWFSTRDIATKSLAFLPASTLADIIIRAMIGHYPERFPEECAALGLQVQGSLLHPWRIAIQVHDSLVLQGPRGQRDEQAARTKAIMTQPWAELDGFSLEVEAKGGEAGQSWGELRKIKI